MKGTLYGIGVGPGDPELLTVKAARLIRECDLVAAPDSGTSPQVALDIARAYIGEKPVISLHLPMIRDEAELAACREAAAATICEHLEAGKTVVFLTLGDPTVYATYTYLHKRVAARGYAAEIVPGVPSFCAAAAALGEPLCEGGEPLHVLPASYEGAERALLLPGTKVLMKSGSKLPDALARLKERGLLQRAMLAERVGLKGERLLRSLNGDETSGYFSVIIVKDEAEGSR